MNLPGDVDGSSMDNSVLYNCVSAFPTAKMGAAASALHALSNTSRTADGAYPLTPMHILLLPVSRHLGYSTLSGTQSDTSRPCTDQLAILIWVLQTSKVTISTFDSNLMNYSHFINVFEDNIG